MSLLTITAGRVLRISPPIEGSNETHKTSPRCGGLSGFTRYVRGQIVHPLRRRALALLVGSHVPVCLRQFAAGYVRAGQVVQEAADPPSPYDSVQAVINLILDGDCNFLAMALSSYTYYRPGRSVERFPLLKRLLIQALSRKNFHVKTFEHDYARKTHIAQNPARQSQWNIAVLLPRILEVLVAQHGEGAGHAHSRFARQDDVVDIKALRRDERR